MHLEIEKLQCCIYNRWAGLFPPVESDASASAVVYTTDTDQTLLIGIARREMHLPYCHFPLQIPFPRNLIARLTEPAFYVLFLVIDVVVVDFISHL